MTKQKKTKTTTKSVCKGLNIKKILTPIVLGLTTFSLLQTNTAFAQNIPAALDLQPFPGINLDHPDLINENPSSPDHSKNILLNTNSKPTHDVEVSVETDKQCVVNTPNFTYRNIDTSISLSVTAVTDGIKEEPIHECFLNFKFQSEDEAYNGLDKQIVVKVKDWNLDLNITPKRIHENPTAPNHTDIINFKLNDKPSGEVKIELKSDEKQCILDQTQIILNEKNWQKGVDVKATAIYDKIKEEPIHNCDLQVNSDKTNSDLAGKNWNQKIEVQDFNITLPTLVNTGAKIIAPPFIGMLVIFAIWFLAMKNGKYETAGEANNAQASFKMRKIVKKENGQQKLISVARNEDGQVQLKSGGVPSYKFDNDLPDFSHLLEFDNKAEADLPAPVGVFSAQKTTVIPAKKPLLVPAKNQNSQNENSAKIIGNKTIISLPKPKIEEKTEVKKVLKTPATLVGKIKPAVISNISVKIDRAKVMF